MTEAERSDIAILRRDLEAFKADFDDFKVAQDKKDINRDGFNRWAVGAFGVYIVATIFGAVWWASGADARLVAAERELVASSAVSERLARVEVLLERIERQLSQPGRGG